MNAFLDTSVLVAAFYSGHERHEPSIALLAQQERSTGCTGAHCLAEVFSVLTGMPGKDRVSPDEAILFLRDVRDRLSIFVLDGEEYFHSLEVAASSGTAGGSIYDALIAQCALKANAESLFTWNTKHFKRLGEPVAGRVREPEQKPDPPVVKPAE